jgi:transducin (beta)-like 1
MTTQISSDELHVLVFRFLQESGFEHSAYVFAVESMLTASKAATADIPCGALISFVHKGLLFTQLEREVEEPKRARLANSLASSGGAVSSTAPSGEQSTTAGVETSTPVVVLKGHQSEVYACSFNTREGNILASGSRDSFARIWKIDAEGGSDCRLLEHRSALKQNIPYDGNNMNVGGQNNLELPAKPSFDVTSLSWSPNGATLATGSLDGRIRLWSKEGENVGSLIHHNGPVFSIKWSTHGKMLLSGGQDKTAIVWDLASLSVIKSLEIHQGQTLDVDWRPFSSATAEDDDDVFASCSSDKTIVVCQVSSGERITFIAHDDEVNAVKWSHDGKLLASCSDDHTAKIWAIPDKFGSSSEPLCLTLQGHAKEVYTVRWCPSGPGSPNPNRPRRLATASFDTTVKIWDPETGKILHSLQKQADAVFAIEFDGSGEHLLSGSFDGLVNVWNVEAGTLIKSVKVGAGVFDVSWNIRGDKFAAASSDGNITVVDF